MAKFQVPTVGGIRKVIKPSATVSNATTIAGLEGTTLTLAQLSQLLATLDKNTGGGNIGTGAEAAISVGPGLAGGGPLVGVVNIRLTAPLGALGIVEDGADGNDGPPGPPGKSGAAGATGGVGPSGPAVFFLADDGADGDLGPPGPPGPLGQTGATGTTGSTGAQGPIGPGLFFLADDGQDGDLGPPGPPGPLGATGATGTTGSTGASGPVGPGLFFLADDGQDGDNGPPGPAGVAGATGTTGSVGPAGPAGPAIHLIADEYSDDQGFLPPVPVLMGLLGPISIGGPPIYNNGNYALTLYAVGSNQLAIQGVAGGGSFMELAGRGAVIGVSSLAIGQSAVAATGTSSILSRGGPLGLGAGVSNQLFITTAGTIQIPTSPLASNVTQAQTGVANFKSGQSTLGTTTLTLDSSLIVTCPETGWYFAELFLPCYEKILGTAGFKFDLDGGNASVGNVAISVGTNAVVGTGVTMTGLATTAAFGTLSTVATNPTWIAGNGTINITGAGSIGIRVAQNTLNALTTETTVLATGASLILTKIG